jgi:hypothetical protein
MEKLERVQSMTYRRMSHIDAELERFEERPELDIHGRYSLLRRRFEELEKLYYKLRRLELPDPRLAIQRVFAEHAAIAGKRNESVVALSADSDAKHPGTPPFGGILSDVRAGKWPRY